MLERLLQVDGLNTNTPPPPPQLPLYSPDPEGLKLDRCLPPPPPPPFLQGGKQGEFWDKWKLKIRYIYILFAYQSINI